MPVMIQVMPLREASINTLSLPLTLAPTTLVTPRLGDEGRSGSAFLKRLCLAGGEQHLRACKGRKNSLQALGNSKRDPCSVSHSIRKATTASTD